jgi:hypothetical protein
MNLSGLLITDYSSPLKTVPNPSSIFPGYSLLIIHYSSHSISDLQPNLHAHTSPSKKYVTAFDKTWDELLENLGRLVISPLKNGIRPHMIHS